MQTKLNPPAGPIAWTLQIIVAIILLQTLIFKFTAAPESVYIFETVGLEPAGRIGSGVVEGIAATLLLVPALAWLGAALALATITGALFFHLTRLGIVVQDDGGILFILAIVVFLSSAVILGLRRRQIYTLLSRGRAVETS